MALAGPIQVSRRPVSFIISAKFSIPVIVALTSHISPVKIVPIIRPLVLIPPSLILATSVHISPKGLTITKIVRPIITPILAIAVIPEIIVVSTVSRERIPPVS